MKFNSKYEKRIPEELFQTDGHYLGRPADFNDRIVKRRIRLVENIPGFLGKYLSLLDIGCGNGASMFLLSNAMQRCIGIEIAKAETTFKIAPIKFLTWLIMRRQKSMTE